VWTSELLERATWCLDARRTVLDSLISELGRADPTTVQRAVVAVSSLGPVTPCVDAAALLRQPEPPRERREDVRELRAALSRAMALADAGRFADALAAATRVRVHAEELGWRPLVIAARAREGRISVDAAMFEQAEEDLQAAYFEAARLGLWDLAAEAATDLIRAVGEKLSRPAEGRVWVHHAEVAAAHAGDPGGLLEASRLSNLANVQVHAGLYAEALALYQRGLAIQEAVLGPEHPRLAGALNNIAVIHYSLGDYPTARALFERALAVREQALGPAHPSVADTLSNLAAVYHAEGAYAEALPLHERAVAAMAAAFGPDNPKVADALNNLASDLLALGQYAASQAQHERALAIRERVRGPEHPDVAQTLENLGNVYAATGRHVEARALLERAVAIQEKTLGRDHPEVASTLKSLAATYLALNDAAAALPLVERAAAIFAAHDGEQPGEVAGHFILARALAATASDRDRALAEAEMARDAYRAAGQGKLEELAEVEAWLTREAAARPRSINTRGEPPAGAHGRGPVRGAGRG
jgi:serine/threonine-protein kinase